jgi:hypothetical protein
MVGDLRDGQIDDRFRVDEPEVCDFDEEAVD